MPGEHLSDAEAVSAVLALGAASRVLSNADAPPEIAAIAESLAARTVDTVREIDPTL